MKIHERPRWRPLSALSTPDPCFSFYQGSFLDSSLAVCSFGSSVCTCWSSFSDDCSFPTSPPLSAPSHFHCGRLLVIQQVSLKIAFPPRSLCCLPPPFFLKPWIPSSNRLHLRFLPLAFLRVYSL